MHYSITISIRNESGAPRVVAESREPEQIVGTQTDEPLRLELQGLNTNPRTLADLSAYGRTLGEGTFHGSVLMAYTAIRARALAAGQPLHVIVSVEDQTLRSLRWERLAAPSAAAWEVLRLQQQTPLSLYVASAVDGRYVPLSAGDLSALVVVADMGPGYPYDLAQFDAARTVESVRTALAPMPIEVLASSGASQLAGTDGLPTLDHICERITARRFAFLHIVCHGRYIPPPDERSTGETVLYLRRPDVIPGSTDSHVHAVTSEELVLRLRGVMGAHGLPHFVYLSACETLKADANGPHAGMGRRLVRELGIPAVLAMTEPIPIALEARLSGKLYERLRSHGSLDLALVEACAGLAGECGVLTPTLLTRLGGRRLFEINGPLSSGDRRKAIARLRALVPLHAPKLENEVSAIAEKLDPLLGTSTTDFSEMERLCREALDRDLTALVRNSGSIPDKAPTCPYPGLAVFDQQTAGYFFGREDLTQTLVEMVRREKFVAVLGGSGTGKSSVVRAGLLPRLSDSQVTIMVPGRHPLATLREVLGAASLPDLIVVDQFEELFTLVEDPAEVAEFLAELLSRRESVPIVITMRADFLGECAEHDELHALLNSSRKNVELLQPLRGLSLRRAVEQQTAKAGLALEPELAARIFEDLENEPGGMPLLQHCLRQLWDHRRAGRLRLVDYLQEDRVGGVKGALSRTAEAAYAAMDPAERGIAPFVFEQLARIDTDAAVPDQRRDTRRREALENLCPEGVTLAIAHRFVTRLADLRLLTTTGTEVELAHEVLIRQWPRLRRWLDDARTTARVKERVRADAEEYERDGKSEGRLTLRGSLLDEAERLARLTKLQRHFVQECRRAERTETFRKKFALTLVLAAMVVAVFALSKQAKSELERRVAMSDSLYRARHESILAAYQEGNYPRMRELLNAQEPELRGIEWHAYHRAATAEIQRVRFDAPPRSIAFGPGGTLVACVGDSLRIDALNPAGPKLSIGEGPWRVHVATDGRVAVTGSRLMVFPTGSVSPSITSTHPVKALEWVPDGVLAVSERAGQVSTWDSRTRTSTTIASVESGSLLQAAMSHGRVAIAVKGTAADQVTIHGPSRAPMVLSLYRRESSMCFSPFVENGRFALAVGLGEPRGHDTQGRTFDCPVRVFRTLPEVGLDTVELRGHKLSVSEVCFLQDELSSLVTSGGDGTTRVWSFDPPRQEFVLGSSGPLAVSPNARVVAIAGDHEIGFWDLDRARGSWPVSRGEAAPSWYAVPVEARGHGEEPITSPDGYRKARFINDPPARHRVEITDTTRGDSVRELAKLTCTIGTLAFSPDGRRLAACCSDNVIRIWNVETGEELLGGLWRCRFQGDDLLFSPDGTTLRVGDVTLHGAGGPAAAPLREVISTKPSANAEY